MSNQQPDNATLKRWVQEAAGWVKEIGWPAFKNDEWLPILVRKSFKSYYENASAAYFRRKYPGQTKDAIVKKLTIVAAKNAAILGAITRAFGARVADILAACTDAVTLPKPPWRERKEKYSAHLKDADAGTLLVSASDKLHNARAILADLRKDGDGVWSRFMGGKEGTLWYYRSLVTAFRQHGTSELIEELDRVVSEMERLPADSNARGYRIKTGSKELGAGEGDHNSADQRSEVQRMEDVQAALANRYEGGSVQARAANEVQKLKCRSPGRH